MEIALVNTTGTAPPADPDTSRPTWLIENRELIKSVKSINASELFGQGNELTFALDRDTKRPVARVVNQLTGELLWQAPPEYVLRLAQIMGQRGG